MAESFIGRAAESAFLDHHFRLAAAGQGQLVLLTGPSGIGKTALVRHSLSCWPVPVLSASGDADEQNLVGGLLGQLAELAHGPEAAALLDLVGVGIPDALAAGATLLDVLRAEAHRDQPLILVVDDAQWADELSLKALTYAFRRLHAAPMLGIVVSRSGTDSSLPSGLRRELASRGERLELDGLTPEDVRLLAEVAGTGRLPRRAAERLREHTDGVPLHLKELLHDLPISALLASGRSLPAPRSLAGLVLSRLARCAADTEALVVAAAILGTQCGLDDAASLAGLGDPLPALQEAVHQGLLVEESSLEGRACAFTHTLLRTAVYGDIGPARRAGLHRAAAELSAGPGALAHRVAGCPHPDAALGDDLETQAGADLARGRPAEAADHLLAAVQVGPPGPDRDRRMLKAVGLLLDLGNVAHATSYAEQISALPPGGLRNLTLGRLTMLGGTAHDAEQYLTDAWTELIQAGDDSTNDTAAGAACELAQLLLGQHRTHDAAVWAERAAATAASSFPQACSDVVVGTCIALAGDTNRARSRLEARLEPGATDPAQLLLRVGLGTVQMWADDLDAAATQLTAGSSRANFPGLPLSHLLFGDLFSILVDYRRGAWDQAGNASERLVDVVEDFDQLWLFGRAHAAAVYVYAARGQWTEATAHADEANAHVVSGAGASEFLDVTNARAALAFAQDNPAAVQDAVGPLADQLDQLRDIEPNLVGFWPIYAHALVRSGQIVRAEQLLVSFETLAVGRQRRSAMAVAARVRGCLEAARQRPDAAHDAFRASLEHLAALAMPYEEALTRLEYGRLLRRSGQRRAAVRELCAARAIFAVLGARPFLERVDAELGSAPQPTLRPGLPLTTRQLSVVQAVTEGKTNRQIANDLYISIKTVEFHINQILTRLGVDSRAEIASLARPSAELTSPAGP